MESGSIGEQDGGGVMDVEKLGCSLADLMYGSMLCYYSAPARAKQVGAACRPEAFINKAVQRVGVFEALSPCIYIFKSQRCYSGDNRYTNRGH